MPSSSWISKAGPRLDVTPVVTFESGNPNTGTKFYSGYPLEVLQTRLHNSVVTPGYKTKVRDKSVPLPLNPFTAYVHVRRDKGGTASKPAVVFILWNGPYVNTTLIRSGAARKWYPYVWEALNYRPTNTSAVTDAKGNAVNKALSRVSDSKINLAQAFAERAQSVSLLVNSVNRLASFALMMRRGNFSAAREVLGRRDKLLDTDIYGREFKRKPHEWPRDRPQPPPENVFGSLWLEFSFGWRPLVADIYGAAEAVASAYLRDRPLSVYARGLGEEVTTTRYVSNGNVAQANHRFNSSAKLELEYGIESTFIDMAQRHGLSNPALLAWELLPYSFVVDWVLPVGTYLKNVSATHGLYFRRGWITTKTLYRGTSVGLTEVDGYTGVSSFKVEEEGVWIQREIYSDWPKATLNFHPNMNPAKWASALALLNQIFGRKQGESTFYFPSKRNNSSLT